MTFHTLVNFSWFILGNIWFYTCEDCNDTQWAVVLVLMILGYIQFTIAPLTICCFCLFLPLAIFRLIRILQTANRATEEEINSLEIEEYNPTVHVNQNQCSICIEDFETGGKVVQLKCNPSHIFHADCIIRWLRINANCPVCRADVFHRENSE